MVDTDTPTYIGYDSGLQAYHYRITGRWLATCGSSNNYCWPYTTFLNGNYDIGSNDAVFAHFSAAVSFVKFRIQSFDACGTRQYDLTRSVTGSNSYFGSFAGVNDQIFPGYTITDTTSPTGPTHTESGPCKTAEEPQSGYGAVGGGGGVTIQWWEDLKARAYQYDVWINPIPAQGSCYTSLHVAGGYTHTWSSTAMTFSLGYPWGVGVGYTTSDHSFSVTQGLDGYSDSDLTSPTVCHH